MPIEMEGSSSASLSDSLTHRVVSAGALSLVLVMLVVDAVLIVKVVATDVVDGEEELTERGSIHSGGWVVGLEEDSFAVRAVKSFVFDSG
jgi:hypothetical protein